MLSTRLCDLLEIKFPILQGALGPHDTSDLALAVSRAGGLGVLSTTEEEDVYRETQMQILKLAEAGQPFGVNIPVNSSNSSERFHAVRDLLGADAKVRKSLKAVITSAGDPARCAAQLREAGVRHLHVVASVEHARKAAKAGCSALIAEGNESGGHVASGAAATTVTLVPAVVEAVDIPVVAAGGFIDGPGLIAALALGAVGIQMGTRFYMTAEASFVHPNIRDVLLGAGLFDTIVVPGTYGENRHLQNTYTEALLALVSTRASAEAVAELKRRGRQAKKEGWAEDASVPIGMAIGRIQDAPTVEHVIRTTMEGAQRTLDHLIKQIR